MCERRELVSRICTGYLVPMYTVTQIVSSPICLFEFETTLGVGNDRWYDTSMAFPSTPRSSRSCGGRSVSNINCRRFEIIQICDFPIVFLDERASRVITSRTGWRWKLVAISKWLFGFIGSGPLTRWSCLVVIIARGAGAKICISRG